jgi:hypothetical protein
VRRKEKEKKQFIEKETPKLQIISTTTPTIMVATTKLQSWGSTISTSYNIENLKVLESELGPGPMRFAPHGERSIQEQIDSLMREEINCVDTLKAKWNKEHPNEEDQFSDEMILRFARCSPGTKKFNPKAAYKVMKKYDRRYLTLSAYSMEKQLLSKVPYRFEQIKFCNMYSCGLNNILVLTYLFLLPLAVVMFTDFISSSGLEDERGT